ncbi:hypothetical protein cyc_03928 [Cyclospora cayetanensis]|uniref:Uncharacterized protein n=1 Tax=Cyclospora cayetanensis TaxID=88456 RepID=A0A1D3D2K4_9EIME|nr:hypothetical protein cyc_03928 [Cyclospora cayetanensis]
MATACVEPLFFDQGSLSLSPEGPFLRLPQSPRALAAVLAASSEGERKLTLGKKPMESEACEEGTQVSSSTRGLMMTWRGPSDGVQWHPKQQNSTSTGERSTKRCVVYTGMPPGGREGPGAQQGAVLSRYSAVEDPCKPRMTPTYQPLLAAGKPCSMTPQKRQGVQEQTKRLDPVAQADNNWDRGAEDSCIVETPKMWGV